MEPDSLTASNPSEILEEFRELKTLLARLIGTADRTVECRFSEEALDRAAKDFLKMSVERGDWVKESEIGHYIKSVPWHPGAFIRNEFAFANWFKRGHEYLYSKKDLIALGQELEKLNIDLNRYKEFREDQAAFERRLTAQSTAKKPKSNGKPYRIPAGLKNITSSEIPKPDPDLVRQDLKRLREEFKAGKFEGYIDIYQGAHAMLKSMYHFQKYLEPGLRRRCQKWCEDFNYANDALKKITGKKEKFIVQDPDLIQL
jgi:hypothetical protein